LIERSISQCVGKGSLAHNHRDFFGKNVNKFRTADNVYFVKESLCVAYGNLFDSATDRYNMRVDRRDRQICDYYESLFNCNTYDRKSKSVQTSKDGRKSFYEDVVYVGTKDDTGYYHPDDIKLPIAERRPHPNPDYAKKAEEILTEYMKGYQKRNPNFYVFSSVLHVDEANLCYGHKMYDYNKRLETAIFGGFKFLSCK